MNEILLECLDHIEYGIAEGADRDTIRDELEKICGEDYEAVQNLFEKEAGLPLDAYIERRILTETYFLYKEAGEVLDGRQTFAGIAHFTKLFRDEFGFSCAGDYVDEDLQPVFEFAEPEAGYEDAMGMLKLAKTQKLTFEDIENLCWFESEEDKNAAFTAFRDMLDASPEALIGLANAARLQHLIDEDAAGHVVTSDMLELDDPESADAVMSLLRSMRFDFDRT